MLTALKSLVNKKLLGRVVHTYPAVVVSEGGTTCRDTFEIREKNDRVQLYHERIVEGNGSTTRHLNDYTRKEVARLQSVFTDAARLIERHEKADFGTVIRHERGRSLSIEEYYIDLSGTALCLFRKNRAKVNPLALGESAQTQPGEGVTCFRLEEIKAIAPILADSRQRMKRPRAT